MSTARLVFVLLIGRACLTSASAQGSATQPGALPPDGRTQLSPAARQVIAQLGDSLRAVHLPDAPIYAKAAEGMLKGADESRILAAVRTLARELGAAREALGANADESELTAGASALHVGATPAALSQLRQTQRSSESGHRSLAVPLVALVDLLARRVPAPVATAAIDSLVARGAPAEDFAALRAAVKQDILAGRTPEAAVRARAQGLLHDVDGRGRTP
jgi:hypothetical protein